MATTRLPNRFPFPPTATWSPVARAAATAGTQPIEPSCPLMVWWRYQAMDPARNPPKTTWTASTWKRRQSRHHEQVHEPGSDVDQPAGDLVAVGDVERVGPPRLADQPVLAGCVGVERRRAEPDELVVPRVGLMDPGAGGPFRRGPERFQVGDHGVDPVAELGALRLGADAVDDEHPDVGLEVCHGECCPPRRAERTTRTKSVPRQRPQPSSEREQAPSPLRGPVAERKPRRT